MKRTDTVQPPKEGSSPPLPPVIEATFRAAMLIDCDRVAEDDHRAALQTLIDTGMAWLLQGRIGREAMHCIETGACVLGPEARQDYWGSRIPSRYEVKPGSLGSVEYAREHGFEVAVMAATTDTLDVVEGQFTEVPQ